MPTTDLIAYILAALCVLTIIVTLFMLIACPYQWKDEWFPKKDKK